MNFSNLVITDSPMIRIVFCGCHGVQIGDIRYNARSLVNRLFLNHQLATPDRPKIVRKISITKIVIWHCKVALHSPVATPGISNQEPLFGIVISYGKDRVTSNDLFSWFRHIDASGCCNPIGFKTFIHCKSEYKRVPFGKT